MHNEWCTGWDVLRTAELRRAYLPGFSVVLAEADAGYTQLLVNRTAMK
jgi:hypothetical protein